MPPFSCQLLLAGLSAMCALQVSRAFVPAMQTRTAGRQAITPLFSLSTEEDKKAEVKTTEKDVIQNIASEDSEVEGLPWWWEMVWKLDIMKTGKEGEPIIFGDSANVLRTNIEQIYGGYDSLDGCPLAGTRILFSSFSPLHGV